MTIDLRARYPFAAVAARQSTIRPNSWHQYPVNPEQRHHRPAPGFRERPDRPQFLAVDASGNESKGDRSPDEWTPPSAAFWCTYAEMYTHVKFKFDLTVTSAERAALANMLSTC